MTSEALLGHNLYAIDAMEEKIEQVIRQLPLRGTDGRYLVDDEQLRTVTLSAQSASKAFWKLCCAARAEIVRRITERTPDPAIARQEVVREAAEQHISPRTFQRDAQIGQVYAPLFAEPDTAPDLGISYYSVALKSPDPPAALALAQEHKDSNPFYSIHDFEADVARARLADPAAGYGAASAGRCGLVYLWPFWNEGVIDATEKVLALPLRQWAFPDAVVIVRTPPRALDVACRIMNVFEVHYQTTFFVPVSPYRDACVWHEQELLVCGTLGKLRLPAGIPGTWRDRVEPSIDAYFPFATPKLAVHPRHGMALGESWVRPEELPPR